MTLFAAAIAPSPHAGLFHGWHTILLREFEWHFYSYLFAAGLTFIAFYILLRNWLISRKIQPLFPQFPDVWREVFYSVISIFIFACIGLLTIALRRLGWIHIYPHIETHGWAYFCFSVAALIFFHDAWFYWTHRAMHWKPLFRHVHRVHHRSHNPTPWAAFAFHPLEAVVEGIVFPLAALLMPIHPLAISIWLLYMIVMNVFGHLGYEVLPIGFARHPVFRWHNTSVHHNMHHSRSNGNYGLYFNIWDRLMGTNHADYENQYDRITTERSSIPGIKATFERYCSKRKILASKS